MDKFPKGRVAFDVETTGLDPWKGARIFLVGLEDEAGNVVLSEPGDGEWGRVLQALGDPRVEKVGWNAKFDLKMLAEARVPVRGTVHDAMLMTYMHNEYEPNLKLKDCGRRHLGEEPEDERVVKQVLATLRRKGKRNANYSDVPRPIMRKYLENDLDLTMRMFWKMEDTLTGPQRRVYGIEREVIRNTVEIERWGVHIDPEYCKKAIVSNEARIYELERRLYDMAGCAFKYNGPQLGVIMESLGLDTGVRNKNGSMKTSVDYMGRLKETEFVRALMELRALNKVTGTYFEAFLGGAVDDVVHPNFWPFGEDEGIKTGRFSSSDPNFQNIPGGGRGNNVEMLRDPGLVRRAVVPRPGYVFLFADYDQIEFTLFACAVGAERILADIRAGVDFHTATAKLIWGERCFDGLGKDAAKKLRFRAKELNFSLIFGMGVNRYAQRAGISRNEAASNRNRYFQAIPEARDFMLQAQADLLRDGYVQDQFGRRYHVPRELCYKAANVLCQGPAALVNKQGINNVFRQLQGLDAHPFITVHDELGVEVRGEHIWDAKHALVTGMEDRTTFSVPITAKVSVAEKSWADKEDWKDAEEKWRPKRSSVSTSLVSRTS